MVGMGYRQTNTDHTVFFRRHGAHITVLAVYVNDMIISGNDEGEIVLLKKKLGKEFEVKDLRQLR
jgi:Reverse transcriptase (RNA-dependent DNA polymerase)